MFNKISTLLKNPFIKNVTIMTTGAAGAQVIAMGLSPLITRLYGPEAFGIMGTFNSMINIIIPVAALTYPIAIVLPKKDDDAKVLIKLSLLLTSLIAFISLIIIMLFNDQIINVLNLNAIAPFIFLIPVVIIFAGLLQVSEQWLIRTKQFSINAKVTFVQSILMNFSKVGVGFFYPYASILVILTSLSNGFKALLMVLFAKKSNIKKETLSNKLTKRRKRDLAREYYDFPLYRAPETLLSAISQGLPVLLLTAFFGSASAGFYTIGRTVLYMPTLLIGKAVEDVFYPRIAEASLKKENITAIIGKTTFILSGIGLIPFGLIILFGPFLFSFVFGNDWAISGEYARWIALWSFSSFISRPSVRSLAVLNAQKLHLIYTFIMIIVRTLLLGIGFYIFDSDIVAIAFFGISGAVFNIGLILITFYISKKKSGLILR